MKLPRELQRFPDPTLLVTTDEERANFWLAGGDSLETLDGIAIAPELKSDREGAFTSVDGSRVAGPSADRHDTPRKEKFTKQVAERIATLIREGHATGVRIASLPEILHRIEAHLPEDVKKKVLGTTPKDLMKMNEVDVVKVLIS
ncbi:hypothetical protein A3E39_03835 [Candidatus Uhrbacteria bacterium RIFCSPHIGHO2_12_FULL_60_25]|uniref:Host attachment protein n=1 Tax=Candidatus Uhrbacteria bacterium RIFCSPHIGHO2_12_FULL_60_25 TaxID=1802399 RepID=A0A1F7UJ31_9BACT|nr:MAG: hypothetical protein A3D73_02030 [Candidatus Uhrbacteria bacterium RIFCSPHIGHO2_02_FULL_60_44]OGL78269.1 MAG: hypothetical protein A3E39_03835 [Candidatus Uhrbacteria bacterium RIFCSPHIGHO2_12_FULL_60_25]